ncbi:unnamed protein product [Bursaphelenchus xylophilus]|uniref:(pine wood nematode) hypothetical protein n=1 Tax=Bursaphelenchus xylophilus TaxID=6326 RepID=A0A1I7SSU9_BURXY|nr:unnamed protein product [Bursaphelenchus xylophilus]CAG9108873.1 unnamed protein product [Bursaphelenchus xylophilus]
MIRPAVLVAGCFYLSMVCQGEIEEVGKEPRPFYIISKNTDRDYIPYMYEYPFLTTNLDHRLYKQTDADSFPIMQAPVALSNPIWNLISHASRMYRQSRRATQK